MSLDKHLVSRLHQFLERWLPGNRKATNTERPRWYAWDAAPWDHPFLTVENLRAMRAFSDRLFDRLEQELSNLPSQTRERPFRFAFTGNMANDLYQRIRALSPHGLTPDLVQNPQDAFLMSDPRWEEFDGVVPGDTDELSENVFRNGLVHEIAGRVLRPGQITDWAERLDEFRKTYRPADIDRWPGFFCLLPLFECLREYDAVLGTQVPFVPYLANVPYLLTQSGSDMRIAANRGDDYGELHRAAYRNCTAFLVSNPWSIAHARRLGLTNMVFLPTMISEAIYKPGPPVCRNEWRERVGGNFFVLSTSRLNDEIKGSSRALAGFVRFAKQAPEARLVIVEWGQQKQLARKLLTESGLADRAVFLPLSGKRRLISYLQSADCLLDQFEMKQLGSTAREALACGLPVVMDANFSHYDACFDGKLPILKASTPEEIAASLQRLHDDQNYNGSVKYSSRQWFLKNLSGGRWAKRYEILLKACALRLRVDYSDSPLQETLSDFELHHHRQGLGYSPQHPQQV